MTAPAAVRETHVGTVLLLGGRAYKLKKPVRTGFLDFSTPALRRAALRRELELNRRLAPDVYLGVAEVGPPAAAEGGSEPLLVMRRMPEERRLTALVTGPGPPAPLRALARLIAAFHAGAGRGPEVDREGGADALRARWAANVAQLAPFAGPLLDPAAVAAVDRLATRFLDGRGPLLAGRVAQGRIVDGHGDLIADDVFCLDDGPRVLDCLEFDDALRRVDGLDDVAFLAMDLERLGRADLAAEFLDAYVEFSGDPAPAALRHHYVAYRAVVRAKVACLRHAQGDPAAGPAAPALLALARRHLEAGAVRVVLVGGLPGTGKSTVAGALADRFGAVLLSSDRIRKELAGLDPSTPAGAPYGRGLYSPEHTDAVHAALRDRAAALLARGESVVLDASWTAARHRDAAAATARRAAADLVALRCRAPAATAAARIAARGPGAHSDATPAVAAAMAAAAEPWPGSVEVPTGGPVAESVEHAAAAWLRAPAC